MKVCFLKGQRKWLQTQRLEKINHCNFGKKKKRRSNRLLDINNNNLHAYNFIFFISYGSTHSEISDSHWQSNLVKFLSFVEQKQIKCTEEKGTNLCNISKTIYLTNTDYIF